MLMSTSKERRRSRLSQKVAIKAVFVRIAHNRRDKPSHLQPQRGGPWQPRASPWGLEPHGTPALKGRPNGLTRGMHKGPGPSRNRRMIAGLRHEVGRPFMAD